MINPPHDQLLPGLESIPGFSLPDDRGVEFSCEASTEIDLAIDIAQSVGVRGGVVGTENAGANLRYYSVGIISDQTDLAAQAVERLASLGLRLTYHPIDLDVCGSDPLDRRVLRQIRDRAEEINAPWLTVDLAMWTKGGEVLINNLVPMPLIPDSIPWAVDRIKEIQDIVQRPLAVENAPYPFMVGELDVLPLMAEIVDRADCLATLDVGHLYGLRTQQQRPLVQTSDGDFCWDRVVEIHIAGNFDRVLTSGGVLFEDYHTFRASPEVWELAEQLVPRAKNVRALMAECELMPRDDLIASVLDIDAALDRWFPVEAPSPRDCVATP